MTSVTEATERNKACFNKAQAKSRANDPRLAKTRRVACGRYEVEGGHAVYTVTVDAAGYRCNCAGANHPACWHRASTYRLRLVEKMLRAPVQVIIEPVKAKLPALEELYARAGW